MLSGIETYSAKDEADFRRGEIRSMLQSCQQQLAHIAGRRDRRSVERRRKLKDEIKRLKSEQKGLVR